MSSGSRIGGAWRGLAFSKSPAMMCKVDFKIKTNNPLKQSAPVLLLQRKFLEVTMHAGFYFCLFVVFHMLFFETKYLGV